MIKKTYGAVLTGTSQTLYTVPAGKSAQWVLMYITNTSGSNGNVEVDFYDASASATLTILEGKSLSSNDFFKVGGEPNAFIMMAEGDKIIASCATNNAVTLLVSVIESNDIIQGG